MDREIPQQEIQKNRNKTWWYAGLAVVVLLVTAGLMRRVLDTSLRRAEIRLTVAETGDVENTLNASGEVQPELEQVVTSPISAVLQQVYFNTGTSVKTGDKILDLDKTSTSIELEKQRDELELKRNGIVKIKLELDKSFYDIKIQDSIKACRIVSLQADLKNARQLFQAGGGTQATIEKIETELRVAQLEGRDVVEFRGLLLDCGGDLRPVVTRIAAP